jgi:glycosyltransferase involved in cell wall biosynthesis
MIRHRPKISVIIPAYYSFHTLPACLEALRVQSLQDFEIILVNSSQEDQTRQIAMEISPRVHFIQHPSHLLPHDARNLGIRHAQGELLIFTDPDCIAKQDWLKRLWNAYQSGRSVVTGSMGLKQRNTLEAGIHLCKYYSYLPGLLPGFKWIAPTANASYARTVLHLTGLFPEDTFAGDAIQSWRASKMGYPVWFEPKAVVDHIHDLSMSVFIRQRYQRGQEFAFYRLDFEKWNRIRIAAFVLLFPCFPWLILFRAFRFAREADWTNRFWRTLPIQLAGHTSWCLGEAVTHFQSLFRHNHKINVSL